MAIIIHSKDQNQDAAMLNLWPDQFVSQKKKTSDEWIKTNMDYFQNVAYGQSVRATHTYVHNYNLVKGILRPEDFYIQEEDDYMRAKNFTDQLVKEISLPSNVKHYPIINPPLNEMVGELTNRPDMARVKAYDDESKNEELQFKTEIVQQYIIQNAKQQIMTKAAMSGEDLTDPDEIQQLTMEHVQEYLMDYTSLAEKWGNHVLEAAKVELNMKEVSEDCFRDLLISAREFYHIFEDNTKLGLNVENVNPKNTWFLTLPDQKYIHKKAYAAGTVKVMEISEVLMRFNLSMKEIKHLRDGLKELSMFSPRESNFKSSATGADTIKYDTYSPTIIEERLKIESAFKNNEDPFGDWLGLSNNVNTFGNKYVVIEAYWLSKKKVGKVTFVDEDGIEQTALVDDTYKENDNPAQVGEVEWNYIDQWYKGSKIGPDIYNVEEFKLLPGCPIIGVVYENKNVDEAKSLVDLLKPYQMIFNVCMNQLWRLLEKEMGRVQIMSLRHVPLSKDGDAQDAITEWEEEARRRGVMFVDDSPENLKSPSSFNQFQAVDLTRTSEIQSRYELAMQMKLLAWELVGVNKERLGQVAATQTATGTNAAQQASYSQTEPYFQQHDYVLNDVYQAILDASQYIEVKKPSSTISYVNTEGENGFIQVNSEDIKLKDLKVFVTSRKKDQDEFNRLRDLAQPMLQNGATPYEISEMFTTSSIRQLKKVMKNVKEKVEAMQQREQELKENELQQQQAQFQAAQQAEEQDKANERIFKHNEGELERLNKREIALITALGMEKGDLSSFDSLTEAEGISAQRDKDERDYQMKQDELDHTRAESTKHIQLELEKLRVERERLQADLKMSKDDNKTKLKVAKMKPKPKPPAKKKK